MADQHRVLAAAEGFVKCAGVGTERSGLVAAVRRDLRRGVSAHPRSHRPVALGGQGRQQVAPGVSGVGEPVQAQRKRPVSGPFCEICELHAVGAYISLSHLGQSSGAENSGGVGVPPLQGTGLGPVRRRTRR